MLCSLMKRRVITVGLMCLVCLLAGCTATLKKYHQDFYIFGTVLGVTLWAPGETEAQQAFGSLHERFQSMHQDWHAWQPGALTEVNRAFAGGLAAKAPRDIIEMVRRSQQVETATEGRFNPAIGSLIELWGFHTSEYPVLGPPPSRTAIDELLQKRPSSLDIVIDGEFLRSENRAVQLDFGGIAKGYAIDIAFAMLHKMGIENAVVNAGGDLRAMGRHGERPWRIAIRSPAGGIIGSLETEPDEAVFTSGNYERFRQQDTERYPHILDPRTGWPVQDLASVTVVASEGLLADAAATAITVAGLDEWMDVARALELDQVLVVDSAGKIYMTPAISDRIDLAEGATTEIVSF
jgi:thiamine biosynthesis lipoprotein